MTLEILFSFITLSLLEIVLGIDNLIFITLATQKLPANIRKKARSLGLSLAFVIRIIMLFALSWIMSLTEPIFTIPIHKIAISYKDILLIFGGLFLLVKSIIEMHADIQPYKKDEKEINMSSQFLMAATQITLIDLVFSFDSIITAVGITTNIPIIIAAVFVSMVIMLFASNIVSVFLDKYPTFKVLALSFILMIGTVLIAEGLHFHIPRAYIYFSFSFSLFVEMINIKVLEARRANQKD